MRRLICLLLLTVALSGFAFGQEGEWYVGKPIEDVRFEGLENVDPGDLEAIVEPFIGREYSDAVLLDLQRRLYALDFFQVIIPNAIRADDAGSAVILRFDVTERPVVEEIRFVGNGRVRSGDLLDVVLLKPGDMITRSKLRLDEEAVRELYLERGFPDVEVSSRTEPVEGESAEEVVFTITEGEQVTIREIRFSGNSFASESTLRGQMSSKQQSIFNKGAYQESLLDEDRRAIETYYRDRGYIDAEVTDIQTEFVDEEGEDRTYVVLTIYIEEGEQYTYGGMTFEGNSIFSDEQLSDLVRQQPGSILDQSRLEQDFMRVADLYYENGYIFNEIDRTEVRDEANDTISYVVSIVERNRAHIENIILKGNEKTKDHVLYRELPFQVGDIFSANRIRQGLQNLANLQYFSSITPEYPQGSAPGLMDLIINVEETSTADMQFGAAFGGSTEFPISAQVQFQDINFLGRGQTLGAGLNLAVNNQRLSFNFLERWLFERRWSAGMDFTVERTREIDIPQDVLFPVFSKSDSNKVPDPYHGYYVFSDQTEYNGTTYAAGDVFPDPATDAAIESYNLVTDYAYAGGATAIPEQYTMDYVEWDISVGATTGYRFPTPAGVLSLSTGLRSGINYVTYDDGVYRPYDFAVRENLGKWEFINRWPVSATLDSRDFYLSPSSGFYTKQAFSFVGGILLGNRHYIRSDSTGEAYFTLFDIPVSSNWNWKLVLAAHTQFSMILPQLWVPQKYRTDPQEPIAGTDLLFIDGMFNARGWPTIYNGQAMWSNWLEFRMPIVESIVWFDTFFDAATIWFDRDNIGEMGADNMLFGLGAGFRFTIPQFPIRFYLAKRFAIRDGSIRWQPGQFFNNPDRPTSGLDFVFSIGTGLF
jgi:outer membrane protein insertion porin family